MLLGAVGLLLLIASVNVANLFLTRSEDRLMDTSIRSALGAGRGRLVRELLTESVTLALVAGTIGVAFAFLALQLLVRLSQPNLPRIDELGLDARVLLFACGVSLLTTLVFGVVPALSVDDNELQSALRDGGRSATRRGGRFRQILIVGEMALAVMLAVAGGLLVRSFQQLQDVDPGFNDRQTLTLRASLPSGRYPDKASVRAFYRQVLDRIVELPGVESVGAVNNLPLSSDLGDWGIRIEGREEERLASGRLPWADWVVTTDGYFEAMGIEIDEGRSFTLSDTADAPPVVLVDETLSGRYWPNGDALGKRFKMSSDIDVVYRTIVGIVADVRHGGLDVEARPHFYLPHGQFPATQDFPVGAMTLVLRAAGDPTSLVASVRRIVSSLDADVPLANVRSMAQVVETSTSVRRLNAFLFGAFGLLGLVLVAVGVYGVMSYGVTRRTRELGVRVALGASRRQVIGLILTQGMRPALAGVAIGMAGALALSRLLAGLLFGVGSYDAVTFVATPIVLVGVALVACYLPARKATRIDPASALRAG